MLPASNYNSLVCQLGEAFRLRYSNNPTKFATGILLFRPEAPFSINHVLPNIEYLDRISEDYVDFFAVGYTAHPFSHPEPPDAICKNTDSWWTFCHEDFITFQKALESDYSADRIAWRYSGNCDLLMMNAIFDAETRAAELGFETVMTVDIETALEDGSFSSFPNLIIEFTRFLETQDEHDPVFALSDKIGAKLAKDSVWEMLLNMLPYKLGEPARKAAHFATKHGG